MKAQVDPALGRALIRMFGWLAGTFVLASVGTPSIVPPGNVWTFPLTLAVIVLVSGAYHVARVYRGRLLFLLYGCLGAIPIMPVFLPDSRDYIAIALGQESLWSYLAAAVGFVMATGLVCRVVATLTHIRADALTRRFDPRRCQKCAYPLYGLAEPRCPECGTPFEHEILPPPDPCA